MDESMINALNEIFKNAIPSTCHHSKANKTDGGSFADSLQESMNAASGNTGNTGTNGNVNSAEHHGSSQQTSQSGTSEGSNASQGTTASAEHHTATYAANTQQTVQMRQVVAQNIGGAIEVDGVRYSAGTFIFGIDIANTEVKSDEELTDLLASTEEMLDAPKRMQEALKELIAQAFDELNDPEMDEEEFTEMVLDFLMEYIDKEFGGEIDSSPIIADDEDDDSDIHDVLLQAVVQMLEEIRSDNTEAPAETETVEEVGEIPASDMSDKNAGVTANELLGNEVKETDEVIETVEDAKPTERNDVPQAPQMESTEHTDEEDTNANTDTNAEVIHAAEQTVNTATVYQAAAQAAESIYAAVIQPQKTESEPIQPVKADRTVSVIQPADELEELTRLVRGGDTVKPEQTETHLLFDQGEKAKQPELADELPKIGETAPFETVMVAAESKPVLTRSFGFEGSSAQQIVGQIASEIFNNLSEAGNGTTTFVMTLNPESLGKVTVKMVEEAGKLSVTVTAHSKHTAELLSDRFENLQAAMKDNGTQLEKYQVVYAPEHDEGSQQNFDGSSKNPYVRQDGNEEGEGGAEFAELLQQAE